MPFVLGLNHRTAPVDVREKLVIAPHKLPETLQRLKAHSQTDELVCLSTCNRTEIYAQAKNRSEARDAFQQIFQEWADIKGLSEHLYYRESEEAVQHLFSVTSGLDSMVQGEHEILAQVKQAYQLSHEQGFTGKLFNVLFQRSLYVGKRVRTETGLGAGAASVGSIAVGMAERIFGSLEDRAVMILGAGTMAELAAKHLLAHKARSLLVANRTFERACEVAKEFGGTAMHFEEGLRQMAGVDIVICSTSAPHAVITTEHVREIMAARKGRSLFLIDIAMPRDVDPKVNDLENVYLYNIDDLQKIVDENQARRSQEAVAAQRIVQDETHEFTRWMRAHRAGLRTGLKHGNPSPLIPLPLKRGEGLGEGS
jgi:glutamyl-tRNA reductase